MGHQIRLLVLKEQQRLIVVACRPIEGVIDRRREGVVGVGKGKGGEYTVLVTRD
ncbi:Uncharacterised protein [Mycobacteroides abscessus subsp. abscessus]|nr:Uncharacterised protein [Mycobacteroides abscessus subsp. abscessus]